MSDAQLRVMTEADLPGADHLRRLVGWNQTPEDWRRMLELEPEGCFAALDGGQLAGTVTTIAYGQTLAWIGMMLVHPEHRRRGIATRLMRRAIEYLQGRGVRCTKLDATPAGLPLYQKLGFVSEWTLTRWQRPACEQGQGQPLPAGLGRLPETRGLAETDWNVIEQIDAAAFGAPRPRLLRSLARDSAKGLVWPAGKSAAGWGLLRSGANADYLGPVECASAQGALGLITALLEPAGARPVIWDVPDDNEAAKAAARRLGFAPLRPLTRMYLGDNLAAADRLAQFAIADPALG